MKTPWIQALLAGLLLCGCPAHQEKNKKMTDSTPGKAPATQKASPEPAKSAAPAPPWELDYGDGSGNGLRFWQKQGERARFAYTPMTPARSSSGTYSGGSPNSGELDAAEVQALWKALRRMEADTTAHAASRMKGTGSFTITTPVGKGAFIMQMSHLDPWETLVKRYRKK